MYKKYYCFSYHFACQEAVHNTRMTTDPALEKC